MKRLLQLALPAAFVLGMPISANALPTLDFAVDADNSSVSITDQSGGGIVCYLSNCGIEASLASGLGDTTFSLGTGDTEVFDFLNFTADGSTGLFSRNFDITATLAFLEPEGANTTSTGSGGGYLLHGSIIAGSLNWHDVPSVFTIGQGSTIGIDFQDGFTLLAGHSVTSNASVTGVNVVPLPATLWLMGLGLAMFGLLRAPAREGRES